MYWYIIAAVIILLLLCVLIRLRAVYKVRHLPLCRKLDLLREISEPFGFLYDHKEDIFTSAPDAWQKDFGYGSLYDQTAPLFHMILDSEPVYFDYHGNTWLIQFWKGQYGINTGAEVGVYRANGLVPPAQRAKTLYFGVPMEESPKISYRLVEKGSSIFHVSQKSWWVTGFSMGRFSDRAFLHMPVCLTFPNEEMLRAFVEGMLEAGYCRCDLSVCSPCVSFCFTVPKTPSQPLISPGKIARIQKKNAFLTHLFLFVTKPFTTTLDRLIYLRFSLPFVFARIVSMKKWRKWHFPRKKGRRHGC